MRISNPKSTESALMPLLQDAHTITFIKMMVPITPSWTFFGQHLLLKHFKLQIGAVILDVKQVGQKVVTSLWKQACSQHT